MQKLEKNRSLRFLNTLDSLGLNEGQSIQVKITPVKKRLPKEEMLKILEQMRGAWADDERITEALAYLGRERGQECDKEF